MHRLVDSLPKKSMGARRFVPLNGSILIMNVATHGYIPSHTLVFFCKSRARDAPPQSFQLLRLSPTAFIPPKRARMHRSNILLFLIDSILSKECCHSAFWSSFHLALFRKNRAESSRQAKDTGDRLLHLTPKSSWLAFSPREQVRKGIPSS